MHCLQIQLGEILLNPQQELNSSSRLQSQFYTNFSKQEHQIDVSFNAWDSQVLSYTPFHFSFIVPLNQKIEF